MKSKFKSVFAFILSVAIIFSNVPVSAAPIEQLSDSAVQVEIIPTTVTQEKPEILPGTNVALKKTAVSNLGIFRDRPIESVTNGVRNSFAQPSSYTQLPEGAGGEWYITIDLERIQTIETVVYGKADLTEEGYPTAYQNNVESYQIQISEDGDSWKALGEITTEQSITANDVYFIPEEDVRGRFVRFYAPKAAAWKTVDEIEVYSSEIPADIYNSAELPNDFPGFEAYTNLALHKPVTTNIACHIDRAIARVTDGVRNQMNPAPGSFAQITSGGNWEVVVDLQDILEFDFVVMGKVNDASFAGGNNLTNYQMFISQDNQNWMRLGTASEEEDAAKALKDIYFIPHEKQSARYIKMVASDAPAWKVLDELAVYTAKPEEPEDPAISFSNVAFAGEGSISEPMHQHHNSGNLAVDGSLQTYVQAENGQLFDFILTFPEKQRFNTVILKSWYNEYYSQDQRIREFAVSTSEDGEVWTRIGEHTLSTEELKEDCVFTLDEPVETRYFKLEMLKADAWVALNELELYDTTTVPPVGTDTLSGSTLGKGESIQLKAYEDAVIYYTDDGSDPKTSTAVKEYQDPIVINGNVTIRAYAAKEGMNDSPVSEYVYYMRYIDADPAPGVVEEGTKVNLNSHMNNADIYYTTDGSDPNLSSSVQKYLDPIEITEYTEINAYCKEGEITSPVYTFTYATANMAEHAVVSAKDSADGYGPENVIDKDTTTYWKTDSVSGSWIMFDMGAPFDFASLKIDWLFAGAGYRYVVETSADAVAWHNYYIQKDGTLNEREHIIPNVETHRQYLRIRVLGSNAGKEIGIREVEILGKKSVKAADVPMYDQDDVTDIYDRPVVNPIPDQVEGVEKPVISLDGQWRFATMPQNGFWKNSTDLSGWYQAKIPGELDAQGIPVYYPNDPNWYGNYGNAPFYPGNNLEMAYKREIEIPEDYAGHKAFLRIDKAFSYARIWINGKYVREHRGEYNAWDADITDYIIPGQKNWVTISVTAEGGADGSEWGFIGLRSFRGILGSVTMYAAPENYLNRLHFKTDLDSNYENATLKVMGNAFIDDDKTGVVELTLKDMDGNPVSLSENKLVIDKNFTDCSVEIPVKNPAKWDAEHPNLYEITAEFKVEGQVVETINQKIGFREVEVKVGEDGYKKFTVNGVPTKLRGVNYHTVYGNDGPSYSIETERELLEKVKEMNVNYIRISHYPMSTEGLEICDELGIYVEQENSITFAGMFGFKTTINENPLYKDYIVGTAAEMVEKDMSHPCIVMWSLGNESFWGANHKYAARYVKAVDPTIPTIFSYGKLMAPPDYPVDEHEETDLFSSHYLDAGSEYNYFDKPIVWDEYAHNYMGNEGVIQVDPGIRDDYYNIIRYNWEKMYNHPQRFGGAIWDFTDNVTEGKTHVIGNGNWGMLDVWGNEKSEFWAAKTVYSPIQYKGENYVSLPKGQMPLKLPYENRYETVSFDDEDFEICYFVNGESKGTLKSSLAPKESGDILIPVPNGGWKIGDKVRLEYYKTTAGIRRIVVADEIIIGKPNYTAADADGEAPEVSETDDTITVSGENFRIDFSKATGKIIEGTFKDELMLVGGPHLSNNLGNQGVWTQKGIIAEEQDDNAVVIIDGAYGSMGCTFTLKIDSEGKIETTYALQSGAFSTLEIGVAYDLPATTETLSWIREGYVNDYKETQSNRETGIAYKETEWKRQWAVEPPEDKGWKDYDKDFYSFGRNDQGGRGTTDFRSSKTGFYYAEMGYAGSDNILSIYGGEGNGSVRAVMNPDKTVRINMNTAWGYPVTNELSNAPARYASVPANHSDTVIMKLSDTKNNYQVSYEEIPETEFIQALSATAGSEFDGNAAAKHLIDNSGMSSDTSLDATHTNSGDPVKWHSAGNPGANAWIQVDLGKVYALDQMWVWNMNMPALLNRGLKNVKIEYSADGKNWTALTTDLTFTDGNPDYPFQFAQGTGEAELKATNLNDGKNTPVSFGGVQARYVKITASPDAGDGTWGDVYYALSELRFTEAANPVDKTWLDQAIAEAEDMDFGGYTEESVKAVTDAIAAAKAVSEKADATQEEVEKAIADLEAAVKALVKKPAELPYKDVEETDWFYDDVCVMYEKGLMTGVDEVTFAPERNLTRNQFAVILWRAEGSPKMEYSEKFADVAEGEWYTDAVLWASEQGIVTGYTNTGLFGPADPISREQAAVMLYRYAKSKGYDVSEKADLTSYEDAADIQIYAKEAMEWAVGAGIIKGKDGQNILAPQGHTNRAETAAILSRFLQKY